MDHVRVINLLREIVAIDPKAGGGKSMYFVTGELIAEARALLDEIDGQAKTLADAHAHGAGFSRLMPDGTVEHLPYETVVTEPSNG